MAEWLPFTCKDQVTRTSVYQRDKMRTSKGDTVPTPESIKTPQLPVSLSAADSKFIHSVFKYDKKLNVQQLLFS